MSNYKNPQSPNSNNLQNYESTLEQNREILAIINEHKKKLNELRNMDNFKENKKYIKDNSFENTKNNKKIGSLDKIEVDDSIRIAKEFLKYNKEKTSKIFNNIESNLNINKNNQNMINNLKNSKSENNHIYPNNIQQNCNKINYHNKTHKDFYSHLDKTQYILNNKNINNIYTQLNYNSEVNEKDKPNEIYRSTSNINEKYKFNIKNNNNYNNDDDIIEYSNIKTLKDKLNYAELRINSLESNIDILTKENHDLKEYIIQLENNNINNKNNFIENQLTNKENKSLKNEEDINDNKEKIMYSINYFIKKMYSLFQNFGCEQNFENLKFEQYNELQQHLNNIENITNDLYIQNIKKENYSLNDNSISDIISTIEYTKKGKKKPTIHKIIKKLENKSAKRLKKKSKTHKNLYNNYNYESNMNKNRNNNLKNDFGHY